MESDAVLFLVAAVIVIVDCLISQLEVFKCHHTSWESNKCMVPIYTFYYTHTNTIFTYYTHEKEEKTIYRHCKSKETEETHFSSVAFTT